MMFEESNFHVRVRFDEGSGWTGSGGYGTTDYELLDNKPSINGHTLIGNKTAEELGLNGTTITIDSSISTTSTNPVQNRVIANAISTVQNQIPTVDSSMSSSSTHPVQNKVIYNALEALRQQIPSITIDAALSPTSTNPVQNKAIYAALDEIGDSLYEYAVSEGYTGTEQEFMHELYGMMLEFDKLIKYEDAEIIETTLYMHRGDIIGTTIYI